MSKMNIIFVGKTGSGKSTVANMISTHTIHSPFEAGDSARGVSLGSCVYKNNAKWNVFDTVGFGEPVSGSVSDADAEKRVKQFVTDISVSFNYVCFVMREGRLGAEDETVFEAVRKIFEGELEKNIVLIVTHSSDAWIKRNRLYLQDAFGNIPMVAVNFPPMDGEENVEESNKKKRAVSLYTLEHFFDYWNFTPKAPPVVVINGFWKYVKILLDSLKRGWRLGKQHGFQGFRYIHNRKYAYSR